MRGLSRKSSLGVALASLAAVVLASCGGGSTASGSKPDVVIGIHLPLSGPNAFDAKAHENGLQLAVNEHNAKGGILGGRKIKTVVYDDKGVPEEGVTVVNKLIAQDHVSAITGTFLSSVALAVEPIAKQHKILLEVSNATAPEITQQGNPFLFRTNSTNDQKADFYAKWIVQKLHPSTVYQLAVNSDYGRADLSAYQSRWKKMPGAPKIMAQDYFPDNQTDFSVELSKAKASHADAVYMATPSSAQNAAFLKQAKGAGFGQPGNPYVLGPGGNWTNNFLKLVGHDADGIYTMDNYNINLPNSQNKAFVAAYEKAYPSAVPPSKYEPMGYMAMNILLDAMNQAGSDKDYAKIMKAVESKTWSTPYGPVTFNKNGQITMPSEGVQVQDGKFALVCGTTPDVSNKCS